MKAVNRYTVRWAELPVCFSAGAPEVIVGRYLILDRVTGDYLEGWACSSRDEAQRLIDGAGINGSYWQ